MENQRRLTIDANEATFEITDAPPAMAGAERSEGGSHPTGSCSDDDARRHSPPLGAIAVAGNRRARTWLWNQGQ
jgi:hypothetical protein